MTPAPASPIVLGPDSTGLARDEAGEPVIVLPCLRRANLVRPEDLGPPSRPTSADVVGATCAAVFSEIVSLEREHFASTGGRADLRAKHVVVSAGVWYLLCNNFNHTRRSGAEMLLRAMPWIDDVRVMTGRLGGGWAVVY